jgi:glycosyltransferase involved in cell wall biosynthesis
MIATRRTGDCRIAIVHDWLTGMRGGERVLEALALRYPRADLFTLVHVPGSVSEAIERHPVGRSPVSRLPGIRRYYRYCLPLFPTAVETFDLDRYDVVISTSHCAVKSAVVPGRARHLCYCFTPMRYAWDQFDAYFGRERLGPGATVMRAALGRLARWDAATSSKPHRYLSISQYVAGRIRRYYNRPSAIVHPPVDTEFYRPTGATRESFALVVSALVPYKRVHVAIEACRLAGVPLVVVGQGPERMRLEALAGPSAQFTGPLPDEQVRDLYGRARVVLLPGVEDFGLVPVEAQACGCPVVALAEGGATETVVDGVTGLLVSSPAPEAFAEALDRLPRLPLDEAAIRAHAEQFSRPVFLDRFEHELASLLNAPDETARW